MACKTCNGRGPATKGQRFVAFMTDAVAKLKKDTTTLNNTIEAFQLTNGPLRPFLPAVGAIILKRDLIDEDGGATVIRPNRFGCVFGTTANVDLIDQPTAAHGAATLVAPQYVVTATHLLVSPPELRVVFGYELRASNGATSSSDDLLLRVDDANVFEIDTVESNGDISLCRLKTAVNGVPPVPVNGHQPQVGEDLAMIGYPFSLPKKVSTGARITKITPESFNATLDGTNGNSGSPVFAADGSLIGILSADATDPAHAEHVVLPHRAKESEILRITLMPQIPQTAAGV